MDLTSFLMGRITGGGSTPSSTGDKPVKFIDYDGTIVYSYTPEEFLALDAMPENPQHEGLISQGWNWSLANAKVYVQDYGILDIGQMYITDDGKTRLYITIDENVDKNIYIRWIQSAGDGSVAVDWGDSSEIELFEGNDSFHQSHLYAELGDYVITLEVPQTKTIQLYAPSMYSMFDDSVTVLRKVELGERVRTDNNQGLINCVSLKSITIPNYITGFYYNFFQDCSSLSSITVPNGVSSLSSNLFYGCSSLISVSLPNTVSALGATGSGVFCSCLNLKRVCLPNGVTIVPGNVFRQCYSLQLVVIPHSVTTISDGAFYGCWSLKTVLGLNGVTSIGSEAFRFCRVLEEITIPDSLTALGSYAFGECALLDHITIPTNCTSIQQGTFSSCYSLKAVTLLSSSATVYMFSTCTSLRHIELPTGFTRIYNGMFSDTFISNILIPNSVTQIDSSAFQNCKALRSITLPEGVSSIQSQVFYGCTYLDEVHFPSNVSSIGSNAFGSCRNLNLMDFSSSQSIPALTATSAFDAVPASCKIVVPDALYDDWIAATNWSTFASRIVKASEVQ